MGRVGGPFVATFGLVIFAFGVIASSWWSIVVGALWTVIGVVAFRTSGRKLDQGSQCPGVE